MNAIPDEELIARCAHGDRHAMDVLVSRYHGKLLDFALRHFRNRDTAADIAQNTLLRAYEAAATYQARSSFRTWLYTITLNLIRDEYRRRRVKPESLASEMDTGEEPSRVRSTPSAEDVAEERARRRFAEQSQMGGELSYEEILAAMKRRDKYDSSRAIAPLRPAEDAVIICSDDLDAGETLARVAELAGIK